MFFYNNFSGSKTPQQEWGNGSKDREGGIHERRVERVVHGREVQQADGPAQQVEVLL